KGPNKQISIKDMTTGEIANDPYVSPGDTVFVPKAPIFFVSGQVKAPGQYALMTGMTLRQAIARGGGLTDQGTERRVKVTRAGKVIELSLDSEIAAGDIVLVGERLF